MTGAQGLAGFKYTIGVGYVALPSDLERSAYLKECYRNSYVCLATDDGGFLTRIPVSPEVMGFLEFPDKPNELGTPVIYATDEQYSHPYIISRFLRKDELGDIREGMFKFKRKVPEGFVEISGSAIDRAINLLVDGGDKSGKINIRVFNQAEDCEVNIDVAGDVNIISSGNNNLTSHKETVIQTIGEDSASFQQSTTENKFYNKKLIVNDGEEAAVLGNKFKDFFGRFIDKISQITTVTAIGLQPIVNAEEIAAMKEELDSLLSTEVFLKQ